MKKIGILGGTFDPPHIGHLMIADEVRYQMELDAIWFIPTNVPPHKSHASTLPKRRLKMVELAIEGSDYFQVNSIEINHPQTSYTINTIKRLKNIYPEYEFYFIIGADMVEYLPHWQQIDQLLELVNFVGVKRADYTLETSYPIIEVSTPMIDISSSNIRNRLKQAQPVKYFLRNNVYEYIKEHHLYGDKERN